MRRVCWKLCGCAAVGLILASMGYAPGAEKELVRNPSFTPGASPALPADWTVWGPEFIPASCRVRTAPGGLLVDAPQEPFAVGGAWQEIRGIQGGKAYAIEAVAKSEKVESPFRSVMVRFAWMKGKDSLHPAGMLVRGPVDADGKLAFQDVLVAPKDANGARLTLEVKWPGEGSVLWEKVSVRETSPPKPRKVKIGTVYLRPRNSTPQKNLELFCQKVDEAGKLGLDIVCLPEAILLVGAPQSGPQLAEPIPGPSTQRLGEAARKNRIWVVAGLYEREGTRLYNTAVLMDREGKLAGKYRKVHLPREEWNKGFTPGHEYPVFKTDFGTVAIQICYDWFYPEVGTIWGLKGAEIVFAPTWGTTFPDKEGRVDGESTFRVRARDNGIYLVPSVFDGNSMVIDPLGRILASNKGREGLVWCEVDLNDREALEWVGHWRAIGPRDRMPSTYDWLLKDPAKPTY